MAEAAGIVMSFAGATAPEGWLLCDGSAVSRSSYSALFAAIGTTYGAGDGSTTFNVPDLTGRVVIGVSGSHALGSTGGEASHVLTSGEMPAHVHEVPSHGHANDIAAKTPEMTHSITQPNFTYLRPNAISTSRGSQAVYYWTRWATGTASRTANATVGDHAAAACTMGGAVTDCAAMVSGDSGSGNAHNNMQPYTVTKYIISTGE